MLFNVSLGQCSDQELLELLQELVQTDESNNTQNNIASQVIRNSQGISPSIISSASHVSVNSSPLNLATPPKGIDSGMVTPSGGANDDTLTSPEGINDDTLTPQKKDSDDTFIECSDTKLHSQPLSFQSDSILFQDSPCSMGGALGEGGAIETVQFTAEQRAQVINLCSHGNEEDLQLDNTYHCSLDECDVTIVHPDDDVIECENDVMSQPWNSEHHLEQQQ